MSTAATKQGSWNDAIIEIGFVQEGYISEDKGRHPACKFTFVPLLIEEVEEVDAMLRGETKNYSPGKQMVELARTVCSQLRSWDIEGKEITHENLRRIRPAMLLKMYRQIANKDSIPESPDKELNDYEPLGDRLGKS